MLNNYQKTFIANIKEQFNQNKTIKVMHYPEDYFQGIPSLEMFYQVPTIVCAPRIQFPGHKFVCQTCKREYSMNGLS
jgi:hypothetical protein